MNWLYDFSTNPVVMGLATLMSLTLAVIYGRGTGKGKFFIILVIFSILLFINALCKTGARQEIAQIPPNPPTDIQTSENQPKDNQTPENQPPDNQSKDNQTPVRTTSPTKTEQDTNSTAKIIINPENISTRISEKQQIMINGTNTHFNEGTTKFKIINTSNNADCSNKVYFNVINSNTAYFSNFTGRPAGRYMIKLTTGSETVIGFLVMQNEYNSSESGIGGISGTLYNDTKKQPISKAEVRLLYGTASISTSTDVNGYFEVNGLNNNQAYEIHLLDPNFKEEIDEIYLGENFMIDIGWYGLREKYDPF